MANEYLYGAYGHIGETVAQSAVQAGTTPIYIGTAPVNLVRGFGSAGIINEPVKLSNMIDAQKKIGYAADWGTFTLCEVMGAHFNNALGNIGPIYVINVLDPAEGKHRKDAETTKALSFAGGRAEFASATIILDTLTISKSEEVEGDDGNPTTDVTTYIEGVDYAVDYNYTKGTVVISSLKEDAKLDGALTATYFEVDDSKIEDADIIGGVTASGEYSGLSSIALLYPTEAVISFNPAYRSENLAYWARAGQMLGATTESDYEYLSGGSGASVVYDLTGLSFSPQIKIEGDADEESLIRQLRELEPEFVDFVLEALNRREGGTYVTADSRIY